MLRVSFLTLAFVFLYLVLFICRMAKTRRHCNSLATIMYKWRAIEPVLGHLLFAASDALAT